MYSPKMLMNQSVHLSGDEIAVLIRSMKIWDVNSRREEKIK